MKYREDRTSNWCRPRCNIFTPYPGFGFALYPTNFLSEFVVVYNITDPTPGVPFITRIKWPAIAGVGSTNPKLVAGMCIIKVRGVGGYF